jgi:hypothetical protein
MIEFSKFKMNLTFQESGAEIGTDYGFLGLDIFETINQVPYFELGLKSNYFEPINKEKNLKLNYQSDVLNYECPLGINSIVYDGESILIRGWLTEWENFKTYHTRYLSNNIKDAINKLKIRDKINYSDNLSGELFQINESNIIQCLALCQAGASVPYWSIGRYSINLKDVEQSKEPYVLTGGRILFNTQDEIKVTSEDSTFNTSLLAHNRNLISDIEHKDINNNFLFNKKSMDIGLKYYLMSSCDYEYECPVGTVIENQNDLYSEVSKFIVTSAYYHYRASSVSTDVQYGGIL